MREKERLKRPPTFKEEASLSELMSYPKELRDAAVRAVLEENLGKIPEKYARGLDPEEARKNFIDNVVKGFQRIGTTTTTASTAPAPGTTLGTLGAYKWNLGSRLSSNDKKSIQGYLSSFGIPLQEVISEANEIMQEASEEVNGEVAADLANGDDAMERELRLCLESSNPVMVLNSAQPVAPPGGAAPAPNAMLPTLAAMNAAEFADLRASVEAHVRRDGTELSDRESDILNLIAEDTETGLPEESGTDEAAPAFLRGGRRSERTPETNRRGIRDAKSTWRGLERLLGREAAAEVTDFVRNIVTDLDPMVIESAFVTLLGRHRVDETVARDAAAVFLNVVQHGHPGTESSDVIADLSAETRRSLGTAVSELGRHIERAARDIDAEFVRNPEQSVGLPGVLPAIARYASRYARITPNRAAADRQARWVADRRFGEINANVQAAIQEEIEKEVDVFLRMRTTSDTADISRSLNGRVPGALQTPRLITIGQAVATYVQRERILRIEQRLPEQLASVSIARGTETTRTASDRFGLKTMTAGQRIARKAQLRRELGLDTGEIEA